MTFPYLVFRSRSSINNFHLNNQFWSFHSVSLRPSKKCLHLDLSLAPHRRSTESLKSLNPFPESYNKLTPYSHKI